MIKGLIINAALSLSFLLLVGQFFKDSKLVLGSSNKIKILAGILGGVFGITLIVFSILVTPTFILDFRQISIIVVAFYGGWIPAVISGVIIGLFRLFYLGINHVAVVGAIAAQVIALGCGLISLTHTTPRKKWAILTVYCLIVSVIVYSILIKDLALLSQVVFHYSIGLSILSIIVYYYSDYLIISYKLINRLKEESTKDFLTGLNNVRSFDKFYNEIIEEVIKRKEQLSILTLDIDFFKKVNDIHGHQAGDVVLKELSSLLCKVCRQFDIISRNGGEEFSVLLIDCPTSKAYDIAERIRKVIEEHKFLLPNGKSINITVSMGVATFPDMTIDKELLLTISDKALYKAKNTGRNKVCMM